jgi:hypothetical protein
MGLVVILLCVAVTMMTDTLAIIGGWCGSSADHCIGPDKWSPCQAGFGKCEVIRPKEYGYASGSTNGRTIGYYQSWNIRNRAWYVESIVVYSASRLSGLGVE